ncbi:hypothetical protein JAAARDRAFT_38062 [Jaapia argillacea MUCL 33604]|uniref:Uncharacterized protein n=1 Tax=Jaapia argillacea MUCL 33604 TaxID=933084 RepID=A0A067PJJ0_9AGAM|nr:hypothetical protein JAAARDRAFT_38062 [Jaapia argillacea MUCL 33604]
MYKTRRQLPDTIQLKLQITSLSLTSPTSFPGVQVTHQYPATISDGMVPSSPSVAQMSSALALFLSPSAVQDSRAIIRATDSVLRSGVTSCQDIAGPHPHHSLVVGMEFIIEPTIARLSLWLGLRLSISRRTALLSYSSQTLAQAVLVLVLVRHARWLGGIPVCKLIICAIWGSVTYPRLTLSRRDCP